MGEIGNAFQVSVGKSEMKNYLGDLGVGCG
jgi:hypothetical protein